MKKTIIFLTPFLLIGLYATSAKAIAESATPASIRQQTQADIQAKREAARAVREEAVEDRQEQIQAKRQQVCESLQARVQNRLNQYEANKEKYHQRYHGIHKKVTDLADKLEARGCDVEQIRNDLVTLEEHTEKFAAAFRVFADHMQSAKGYACDEVDSDFRGRVQQARTQVTTMQQEARQLHDFIFNTLKPHLRQTGDACKAQVQTRNLGE